MSSRWIDVCASEDLVEGADGIRFDWIEPQVGVHGAVTAGAMEGRMVPAFVVRFGARPRAFLNRCAHRSVELDWMPGRFFDDAGLYLVCALHGALYEADSGRCVAGPCRGAALTALPCQERDGRVRVACPAPDPHPAPDPRAGTSP